MPYQIFFAEDAEQDLEDLYRRFVVGRDGTKRAESILDEIEQACATLVEFPQRGNVPKELADVGMLEYRELHHKPWRTIYRNIADRVVIYCMTDGRRDMRSFLERRLLR